MHGHPARFAGVSYDSCVDQSEHCWGLYGRTPILPASVEHKLLDGGEAEAALRRAADYVGIHLPKHLFDDPYP